MCVDEGNPSCENKGHQMRRRRWPSGLGRCDCDWESMGLHPGWGKKSRAEFVAKNMRVAVSGLALGPNILGQDVT